MTLKCRQRGSLERGARRPPERRYTSRPTSPSPSYETALGPFRRCRRRFPKIRRRWSLSSRDRRWTLVAVCTTTFMLLLDITVVERRAAEHPAAASREPDRDCSGSSTPTRSALAALILTAGAPRRPLRPPARLHRSACFSSAAASLLCGLAWNIAVLDVARALQGVGGAALFATALGADRGRVPQGRSSAARSRSGAQRSARRWRPGRSSGGILTDALDWRWVFFVNVPVGAFALVGRGDEDARVARSAGDAHRRLGAAHVLGVALPDRLRRAARQCRAAGAAL